MKDRNPRMAPYEKEWNIHTPQDNCPAQSRNPFKITFGERDRNIRPNVNFQAALQEVARAKELAEKPIKILKDGDAFVFSEYPTGTIVHFDRDVSYEMDEPLWDSDYWGMLTQERKGKGFQDVLIAFSWIDIGLYPFPATYPNYFWTRDSIQVGNVNHLKGKKDERTLITDFKVVALGQSVRERSTENAPQRSLNPQVIL